jgi:hypothetical protein
MFQSTPLVGLSAGKVARQASGVVVDGPQRSHRPVGSVGAVCDRDPVMPLGDHPGVVAEHLQRRIEPVSQDALDVIGVAPDRRFAALLPLEVGDAVARPGFPEGDVGDRRRLRWCDDQLAFGDLGQHRLGLHAGVASRHVARAPDGDLLVVALAVPPAFTLDGEGLAFGADHDEKAPQLLVADHVLTAHRRRQTIDRPVRQVGAQLAHGPALPN